jgi:NTP pyrophosphatase (non-canonical NTP hydrolase)
MYYIYHIPGKKIGVTRNLKNRVEVMQGYKPDEYQVLESTTDLDRASTMEIKLQKAFGYPVDRRPYKEVIKSSKPEQMKINVTDQTTTFPCPKNKVKGQLMDNLGLKWETTFGEVEVTEEVVTWIEKNAVTSMYDKERCFVYNKALHEAFNQPENLFTSTETVFDHIRNWAEIRGIYDGGDEKTQYVKLMEEAGELAEGILKERPAEVKDAIGDMVVVLTNLAHLVNMRIEDCIESAYNEIKDRKGSMSNGTFVKEQL